ncbi:MAG: helix-turn-helix transcriptional regulator, partial [Spirochaetaceae bacterium]|nr:helix-turn-helix transcriptional regulator [Spirochaetaceae bacterium]
MPKLLGDAKGAILRAVREHLPTEGWAALNIRTIAQRAGMAQGTIYNYFPSREAI